jgi:hypothetical protein
MDATAYDAFGRILSYGGEQTYAAAIARGYSESRASVIMIRKFGDDFVSAKPLLAEYVDRMITAADGVTAARDSGGTFSLSDVPNNPFLSEDDSGGQLFRWAADVDVFGGSSPVTVYGWSSSNDIDRLISEAIDRAIGIVDQYRQKFGLDENQAVVELTTKLLFMQSAIPNGSTSN